MVPPLLQLTQEKENTHHQNHLLKKKSYLSPKPFPNEKKSTADTGSTSAGTITINTDFHSSEMEIGNKVLLFNIFFMCGFIRAITKEKNEDFEISVVRQSVKEMEKLIQIFF